MTVTITAPVKDIAGRADESTWIFASGLREAGGVIVSPRQVWVKPVDGVLTVELEPGPCTVQYNARTYLITVPDEDADLWPLLEAAVAAPPGTPAEALATAVASHLSAHPVTWGAVDSKPAVIAAGEDQAAARSVIGAAAGNDSRLTLAGTALQPPALSLPTIIAHRGLGDVWNGYANGPLGGVEETDYSISAAFAAGVESVRIHVRSLQDGALAVIHDSTVDRTLNGAGNVTDYDTAAWRMLTAKTTQAGYNLTLPVAVTPPLLRDVLTKWGGTKHLQIHAYDSADKVIAMVQELGLTKAVTLSSTTPATCAAFAAAGIDVMYFPPDYGTIGYDAATMAALDCWPVGHSKHVGINYQVSRTVSVTTTSGSAAVTAASGLNAVNGWNVQGTGVPYGTTFTATSDTGGNLSANATASGTVTLTFWPTQAQMTTYIQALVTGGLEVTVWVVNNRHDKSWLAAAGATHFGSGDPVYLGATAQLRTGTRADPATKGSWPHGRLLADPFLPGNFGLGRGNIAGGGQALDKDLAGSREMRCACGDVAFLGAIPATYAFKADVKFATLPSDTTRWLGVMFAAPTDAPMSGSTTTGTGLQDCYQAIIRANGQLQVHKLSRTGGTITQIGSTQTMSSGPAADTWYRLIVAVTATTVTVTVKDVTETTAYATTGAITDATHRGGHFFIGKAQNSSNAWTAVFKNITAA